MISHTLLAALSLAAVAIAADTPCGCVATDSRPWSFLPVAQSGSVPRAVQASSLHPIRFISHAKLTSLATLKLRADTLNTLTDGVIKDDMGRQAYIADNFQFQYDAPPQAGAIKTSGFSLCPDGTIALDGSKIFYTCDSGSFANIYSQSLGGQCRPVNIQAYNAEPGADGKSLFSFPNSDVFSTLPCPFLCSLWRPTDAAPLVAPFQCLDQTDTRIIDLDHR